MTLIDALAQPRVIIACVGFAAANLLLARIEHRFLTAMGEHALTAWLAEHIYLPLARVFSLLLFIGLAYPALFGLREAPGLATLLALEQHRVSHLINLGFLSSLLLPLLPVAGRLPGLVLPIQGLLAAALLFSWLAEHGGIEVNLWPGGGTAALILLWLILGQRLAAWLARRLDYGWQTDSAGTGGAYYEIALLFCQIPAILLYTLGLSEQLHSSL